MRRSRAVQLTILGLLTASLLPLLTSQVSATFSYSNSLVTVQNVPSGGTGSGGWRYGWQQSSFYARGLYWFLFDDQAILSPCGNLSILGCLVYDVSSDGLSWHQPPGGAGPFGLFGLFNPGIHVRDQYYSVWHNDTTALVVTTDVDTSSGTCNRPLYLYAIDLFSDGASALHTDINGGFIRTVKAADPVQKWDYPVVAANASGAVFVGYQWHQSTACGGGTGNERPAVIQSPGGDLRTWINDQNLTTAHSNNWKLNLASLVGSQFYASYWYQESGGVDLHGRLWTGSSWQSDEQVSDSTEKTGLRSFLLTNGALPITVWFDNATERVRSATRSPTGVWSRSTVGTGESFDTTCCAISAGGKVQIGAGIESSIQTAFVFWYNFTNNAVDAWTSPDPFSSWSLSLNVFHTAGAANLNSGPSITVWQTSSNSGPTTDVLGIQIADCQTSACQSGSGGAANLEWGLVSCCPLAGGSPPPPTCFPCANGIFQTTTVHTLLGNFTLPVELLGPLVVPATLIFSATIVLSSLITNVRIPFLSRRHERKRRRSSLL